MRFRKIERTLPVTGGPQPLTKPEARRLTAEVMLKQGQEIKDDLRVEQLNNDAVLNGGNFETDHKLNVAVDRLLDAINRAA